MIFELTQGLGEIGAGHDRDVQHSPRAGADDVVVEQGPAALGKKHSVASRASRAPQQHPHIAGMLNAV